MADERAMSERDEIARQLVILREEMAAMVREGDREAHAVLSERYARLQLRHLDAARTAGGRGE